jgi:hypothetical protein
LFLSTNAIWVLALLFTNLRNKKICSKSRQIGFFYSPFLKWIWCRAASGTSAYRMPQNLMQNSFINFY